VRELTRLEVDRLYRAVRGAVGAAIGSGGVHTLSIIPYRRPGAMCPRDGVPMTHATVGGRTTWWCPRDQAA
jgi:formamidopyrimidine-DNA glycosylase